MIINEREDTSPSPSLEYSESAINAELGEFDQRSLCLTLWQAVQGPDGAFLK